MKHYKEIPVEVTNTITFPKRDVDRVVEVERCFTEVLKTNEQTITTPEVCNITRDVPYRDREDCKIVEVEREVLRVDQEKYPVEVYKEKIIEGLINVVREVEVVPEYF